MWVRLNIVWTPKCTLLQFIYVMEIFTDHFEELWISEQIILWFMQKFGICEEVFIWYFMKNTFFHDRIVTWLKIRFFLRVFFNFFFFFWLKCYLFIFSFIIHSWIFFSIPNLCYHTLNFHQRRSFVWGYLQNHS